MEEKSDDDTMVSKVLSVLEESKRNLRRLYGIRTADEVFFYVPPLLKRLYGSDLSDQQVEEKVIHIMNEACMRLRDKFLRYEDELELDEWEYKLRRSLVEYNETVKEKGFVSKFWLEHLRRELKDVSTKLRAFVKTWKYFRVLPGESDEFLDPRNIYDELLSISKSTHMNEDQSGFLEALRKMSSRLKMIEQRAQNLFTSHLTVRPIHVAQVASSLTGIPVPWLFSPSDLGLISSLKSQLQDWVVGQDHVIDAILKVLFPSKKLCATPVCDTRRPLASFLFWGPSGAGKTELAKGIAKYLFCDMNCLIQIDMSEFADRESVSSVINPLTCLESFQRLFEFVRVRPHSLVIFDNIDKAQSTIIEALLPIFKNGGLTDGRGHIVDFSKTIVIMTSDVRASFLHVTYGQEYKSYPYCLGTDPKIALKEARRFFNRDLILSLDDILFFNNFVPYGIVCGFRLMLRDIAKQHAHLKLVVNPSDAVLRVLIAAATKYPIHGERANKAIRSWLEENVVPVLSTMNMDIDVDEYPSVYIDTLVGTEDLSFRLDTSRYLVESWSLKEWKVSLSKLRVFCRREKEKANHFLIMKNILSRLVDSLGECSSHVDTRSLHADFPTLEDWLLQYEDIFRSVLDKPNMYVPRCLVANRCLAKKAMEGVESFRARLQERIKGQHQACDLVANAVISSIDERMDLHNQRAWRFLVLGLSSFGKMDLVNSLSDVLGCDDGESMLIQLDLSELLEPQLKLDAAASSGVAEHEKCGFWIMDAVKARPYSVLLLDQIGKANSTVYNTLLRILDTGFFTGDGGVLVDFRSTTIIMLSDLGNKDLFGHLDLVNVTGGGVEQEVNRFRSELLKRMDEIIFFDSCSRVQKDILRLSLMGDCLSKGGAHLVMMPTLFFHMFSRSDGPVEEGSKRSKQLEMVGRELLNRMKRN